jgi:hypothetical protein
MLIRTISLRRYDVPRDVFKALVQSLQAPPETAQGAPSERHAGTSPDFVAYLLEPLPEF